MKATLAAASSWSLGGADADLAALPELAPGMHPAPAPMRPEAIPAAIWRRMGRAARLAAVPAAAVLDGVADRGDLALFWGTMSSEHGATRQFIHSLAHKGPAGASPLAFQHSVHNAPAGLLSMSLGLTGPSETICAGPHTGFALIERALIWVTLHGRPALVVGADELGPEVQAGLAFAPGRPYGEGGAALLLLPDGGGRSLSLVRGAGAWRRRWAWPEEAPLPESPQAHDARLGLYGCVDLVAVASLARAGGTVGWDTADSAARVDLQ